MEWYHVFGIILGNGALIIPLFIWNRTESRNDIRHMDVKFEIFRNETKDLLIAIQTEMKDFHGRLCTIEERNRK